MEWMTLPLKRYADFSGRSRRLEYADHRRTARRKLSGRDVRPQPAQMVRQPFGQGSLPRHGAARVRFGITDRCRGSPARFSKCRKSAIGY